MDRCSHQIFASLSVSDEQLSGKIIRLGFELLFHLGLAKSEVGQTSVHVKNKEEWDNACGCELDSEVTSGT